MGEYDAAPAFDSFRAANIMRRPRVDRILETAARCSLVYVIAGAGYGKTQAVGHYVENCSDAVVRWVQLSESDNIGSHYWENLTHNVSFDNPELAEELRRHGFPETVSRFRQFAQILRNTEHRSKQTFLVLDDFHNIRSPQALAFAERCAYLRIPGACVVIISRKEPEINAASLFSRGQACVVTEDELRFTRDELAEFFLMRGIPQTSGSLARMTEATKGWALAIQLLALVLKRNPANTVAALATMRQNIFKLMEVEAFNDFPPELQKDLIKSSLIQDLPRNLPADGCREAAGSAAAAQLASFIWYDSLTGEERIHPLYREFLQSKQHMLTSEEVRETYVQAADWCAVSDFCLDSMLYLAKAGEYERMVRLLFSHPFKLPRDTCEYFAEIIESLEPEEKEREDASVLLLKNFFMPLLLVGMGRYVDAEKKAMESISRWEGEDSLFASRMMYLSYSSLVYIDMYLCTATHKYNSPEYIRKSMEHYKNASIPLIEAKGAFFVPDLRSLACPVGIGADIDEFDEFLEATGQIAQYIARTHHNMYHGFEDLALCELEFYKNRPAMARSHAQLALRKAREKKQYGIEAMATQYLLRMSMQDGDYPMARELLKQLRANLDNPDYWNRQLLHDLFMGFFFAQIGLPKLMPDWLAMDDKDTDSEVRIPARELVVAVKRHIASGRHEQALSMLNHSYPREPHERFLLSELVITLLTAVATLKTGDTRGGVNALAEAYELSFRGGFEMPFVELGKDLRPLATAALDSPDCGIPTEWLKTIDRKASIYAKKVAAISSSYKKEQKIEESVSLSARESEVLSDLYHGLSRDEIAENRFLSVNTVKKLLQSIYIKLDASNSVDAVRVAIEKNMVE